MQHLKKRIVLSSAMLFTAMHFALVWLYMLKPNPLSSLYVYPFFHQDWALFVPPPQQNYFLYANTGSTTTDIFAAINNKHLRNRLSGNEVLTVALSNSIHYFETNALIAGFDGGNAAADLNFAIIEKIIRKGFTRETHLEKSRIILCIIDVKTGKRRVYFN